MCPSFNSPHIGFPSYGDLSQIFKKMSLSIKSLECRLVMDIFIYIFKNRTCKLNDLLCMQLLHMLPKLASCLKTFSAKSTLPHSRTCCLNCTHVWKLYMQLLSMLPKLASCLKTFSAKSTLPYSRTCIQNCSPIWIPLAHKSQLLHHQQFSIRNPKNLS